VPSVPENRQKWSAHRWSLAGHEWSPGGTSAGTEFFWWRSIRPRVHNFLPAKRILEIAPGFGRWTSYLLAECESLLGVDVTSRCVEACRHRFEGAHAEFWENDGESLPMVEAQSIDFAFSFDSLVHVEAAQVRSYLHELGRVLRPGAGAFLHHSNLGAYVSDAGQVPWFVRRTHWRAASMSAGVFRHACREAGLLCVTQEVINWIGRGADADRFRLTGDSIPLTDCFSLVLSPSAGATVTATHVFVNRRFVDEWRQIPLYSRLYARPELTPPVSLPREHDRTRPPVQRALRALREEGIRAVAARASARLAAIAENRASRAREHVTGRWFMQREPFRRRIVQRVCPDCGSRLRRQRDSAVCPRCFAAFVLD
jgi:ubiquinone/menaquinone biosynthesis C-methylase UbiE